MAEYTFYVLGFDNYLVGGTVIDCLDDAAARAHATKLLGTFNAAVEVWNASRRVAHLGASPGFSDTAHKVVGASAE
jgi:hypothetical protein